MISFSSSLFFFSSSSILIYFYKSSKEVVSSVVSGVIFYEVSIVSFFVELFCEGVISVFKVSLKVSGYRSFDMTDKADKARHNIK